MRCQGSALKRGLLGLVMGAVLLAMAALMLIPAAYP